MNRVQHQVARRHRELLPIILSSASYSADSLELYVSGPVSFNLSCIFLFLRHARSAQFQMMGLQAKISLRSLSTSPLFLVRSDSRPQNTDPL